MFGSPSLIRESLTASRGGDYSVICGFSGDKLAESIAKALDKPLLLIQHGQFKDTSSNVKINIQSKSGLENKRVFLIASNCRKEGQSINDTTMEIYFAVDAAKQAGAREINLYIPHLGYARQDKVSQSGEPLAAQVTIRLFEAAGARKITVLDIHNEGVFSALTAHASGINKFAMGVFANRFKEMKKDGSTLLNDLVVVAPDKGAIDRATLFLQAMQDAGFENVAFAYFDKSRDMSRKGEVQTMELREVKLPGVEEPFTGDKAKEVFKGRVAVLVDDMADTCGTLLTAISKNIVGNYGAKGAFAAVAHGVFSGDALQKIAQTAELIKIFVTDSIPLRDQAPANLEVLSCAPVFAEAISADMNN